MTKVETLVRLCSLCSKVGTEKFHHELEHDCFCGAQGDVFQSMHPEVISYIENAVKEKLDREKAEKIIDNSEKQTTK